MKIIEIVLILFCLYSCSGSEERKKSEASISSEITNEEQLKSLFLSKKKNVSFFYDNSNFGRFGAEFFEHDLPVGQQDILLQKQNIYVLDRFHNNIKVVDMNGELLIHTPPLSKKQLWLKQLEFLQGNILVISELDSVYVFSEDLTLIGRKYIQKGNGRIFSTSNDRIILYYPQNGHEFVEINIFGEVTHSIKGIEHKADYPSKIIFLEKGSVKYKNEFYYYPKDLVLQDKIFDINNGVITYYSQDEDSLRLSILHFAPMYRE